MNEIISSFSPIFRFFFIFFVEIERIELNEKNGSQLNRMMRRNANRTVGRGVPPLAPPPLAVGNSWLVIRRGVTPIPLFLLVGNGEGVPPPPALELPLCTGGRCHKWRILLRRSYTSSICMIPFVSCCEKDRKIIYSYIIEVHMLWSVQKDNVKQRREDIERIKSQPSNAWYFKSKSRNPRTMKRQGRKYPLQLKNTTTSTCSVALTQHAGFLWFQRKTL